jgi:hypothetical protein
MNEENVQEQMLLNGFEEISLKEMDAVKLMNRTDTKFVFKRSLLPQFLQTLQNSYRVLTINNQKISSYKTLYFDTPKYKFFLDHHNGRTNRFKVRIRNYVESDLFFLEIKNKFKGRTIKSRIRLDEFENPFSEKSTQYLETVLGGEINLEAKLWNTFERITLVNTAGKERLTLDLNLSFDWDGKFERFHHIVIAELKQENVNRDSDFYALMKQNNIRSNSMSKYCVGAVSLNSKLKYNNFKNKIILIDNLI